MNRQKREEMLRGSSQQGAPRQNDRGQQPTVPRDREQMRGSQTGANAQHQNPPRQSGRLPLPD